VLPRFTTISITQLSEGETAVFNEAYGQNRLKSLLHYWLALIENPARELVIVSKEKRARNCFRFSARDWVWPQ
jgi:hypothetical protein